MPELVRIVLDEPVAHQVLEVVRQAQQHVAGLAGAGPVAFLQDRLDLVLVDRRDDRRDEHRHRDPGRRELPDRVDPLRRGRGARLHPAGEGPVEGGDRDRHLGELPVRHPGQDVDVAGDEAPTW